MPRASFACLKSLALAVLVAGAVLAHGTAAEAKKFALLIGVSGYGKVGNSDASLNGPKNDVVAMATILKKRGFDEIRILADGLDEDQRKAFAVNCVWDPKTRSAEAGADGDCPTWANIEREMKNLARDAGPSDFVYIQFSGHGVQLPWLRKPGSMPEEDNREEAFVPLDVKTFDEAAGSVENAIYDDQIGEWLAAIGKNAGFIWTVFDACNSGTMTRGARDEFKVRALNASTLGVTPEDFDRAAAGAPASRGGGLGRTAPLDGLVKGTGNMVAFYAVQAGDLALELRLPDASGKPMGGFTYAIIRALETFPNNVTYRQIAQSIIQTYADYGAKMPAPFFEGDLDQKVLGGGSGDRNWSVKRGGDYGDILKVAAGKISNLTDGTILALHSRESLADKENAQPAHGYAEVTKSGFTDAEIEPIDYRGERARAVKDLPESGVLASVMQRKLYFDIRLAMPNADDYAKAGPLAEAARGAIEDVLGATDADSELPVRQVAYNKPADIYLRLEAGRIWLLGRFGKFDTADKAGERPLPSIKITDVEATAKALRDNLWRYAKARNLIRVAGEFQAVKTRGGEDVDTEALEDLQIKAYLLRDATPAEDRAAGDQRRCKRVPTRKVPREARKSEIEPDKVPRLSHCDVVYLEIRNEGTSDVDLTVLYIDGESGISAFRPGGPVRVRAGKEKRPRVIPIQILTRDPRSGKAMTIGREQIVIIGVKVDPDKDTGVPASYAFLEQRRLSKTRGGGGDATRAGGSAFAQMIRQAALERPGTSGNKTRGAAMPAGGDLEAVTMSLFRWDVKPPAAD